MLGSLRDLSERYAYMLDKMPRSLKGEEGPCDASSVAQGV